MKGVLGNLPGLRTAFTQPIEMRYNELASGIRSDVGIKIYGDDFEELIGLGVEVQKALARVEGAADVAREQITGQPVLQIAVRQDQIARYGIAARDVLDLIETVGTREVGDIVEGQRRFPLAVRLPAERRRDVEALARTPIPTRGGPLALLRELADVKTTEGPATINREWGRRFIKVECNVRGRDVASFVREARARVAAEVRLPEGYVIDWGGQFENLERSKQRLMIVVPLTFALIFVFLLLSLKGLGDTLIVFTGIPFAAVGGVLSLWLRGIPFSVSAAVGFIALSGIAVLNGQILVSTIRTFWTQGLPWEEAVTVAARQRLRPVLATATVDAAGFVPMALSTGVGAEVQRPLATVVIGGLITSTVLTLLVLPAIYTWIGRRHARPPA
jgi:cobalt-zinc-cadmium resistance protein CzcA